MQEKPHISGMTCISCYPHTNGSCQFSPVLTPRCRQYRPIKYMAVTEEQQGSCHTKAKFISFSHFSVFGRVSATTISNSSLSGYPSSPFLKQFSLRPKEICSGLLYRPVWRRLYYHLKMSSSTNIGKRWYVVFEGRRPGVYQTWEECNEQRIGMRYPQYRKFNSYEAATYEYNQFLRTGLILGEKWECGRRVRAQSRSGTVDDEGSSSSWAQSPGVGSPRVGQQHVPRAGDAPNPHIVGQPQLPVALTQPWHVYVFPPQQQPFSTTPTILNNTFPSPSC